MNTYENNKLLLTSLFDNLRESGNDISSFIIDCACDEELNTGVSDVVDDIWTLYFLSNGLRGGIAGGLSSVVNCTEGTIRWLFFLFEGDDEGDFVGIKKDFDDWWWSSSNAALVSAVDGPWSFWSLVRPSFRLN